jgi:CubicO group peptidase (beta-lactamase class C family)
MNGAGSARISGWVAPGFEPLRDAFAASFDGKPQMGAALAIRRDGEPIVDLWAGTAAPSTGAPWSDRTVSVIFSCTKGLMSILAAQLVRDGRLRYSDRVSEHWPEFAAADKGATTVGELLSHRAGLSAPRHPFTTEEIAEWSTVTERLAAQEPLWPHGAGYAYHAITHGWLAGEVIRRITGSSVGEVFAGSVAGPLAADAWIGMPQADLGRVAEMQVGPSHAQYTEQLAAARTPGVTDWSHEAMTLGGALPSDLVSDGGGFNDPRLQMAEIPGAGGIASARALASIWSATVVETDGVRLLDDATLDLATQPQSEGPPVWDVPGPWPRWGMGFQLDSEARRYLGDSSFGHDGAGGQVAFADRDERLGFAFLTNQMEAIEDVRATAIVDTLRGCLS